MSSNMDNEISASALSEALSKLALSDNDSETSETTTMITDDTTEFNDRTAEIRDARLANAILCLDEDIPEDLDDSIKDLLQKHTTDTTSLGSMSFLVSEHYLDFKVQREAKKATEKKLPRSNRARAARP
ncbi:uncharacterized protein RAG0_01944 [Rhynchosporium agropyri]|uniref:Uncharacterized protein n=1 Tax=Rhynchosporium agropyri TaxID=914238 RepID=A0A1E1JZB2_9HELO|nr:uncharacterized protein RAG0_01944 [Rhynchosporium agropyri]